MPIQPSDYKLKVLLGLPFAGGSRYVPPEWAVALAALAWPMNCRYAFYPVKGLAREGARTEIIEKAIELKAQYVAMMDDDIQPGADAIQQLVRELDSHDDLFAVISAVCPSVNREPMVFKQPEMGPFWRWKKGEVFEIAECATALILIRTSVFDKLEKPWFRDLNTIEERVAAGTIGDGEAHRGAMTDDIYFCRKVQAAGFSILAHGGVLPVHWDRKGNYYKLPDDSYPFISNGFSEKVDAARVDIARALEITGWMTKEELEWLADQASRITVEAIAEIGCWQGRSTRALADNTRANVYAIDTWAGPPDRPNDIIHAVQANLPLDWTLEQFKRNLADKPNVHILQMSSIEAAEKAVEDEMLFDLVFIDAAHDYDSVKADINAWLPLVRPGGVICGHDYSQEHTGVVQAVKELLPGAKHGAWSIWYDVVRDG